MYLRFLSSCSHDVCGFVSCFSYLDLDLLGFFALIASPAFLIERYCVNAGMCIVAAYHSHIY